MIVDTHMHVYPLATWGRRRKSDHRITEYGHGAPVGLSGASGDLPSLVAELDRAHVDVALALNLVEPGRIRADIEDLVTHRLLGGPLTAARYVAWLNDWLCSAVEELVRVRPVVTVDPRLFESTSIGAAFRRWAERGAVAVKLHHGALQLAPSDPALEPVYAACAEHSLPIIAHCGPPFGPEAFAETLSRWPQLKFVLAHSGGAMWGGMLRVIAAAENAYVDLAEVLYWVGRAPGAPSIDSVREFIKGAREGHVLFGSDFPWYEPDTGIALVNQLGLTPSRRRDVLGEAAIRVFRLTETQKVSSEVGRAHL